jgi:hypothetical protein
MRRLDREGGRVSRHPDMAGCLSCPPKPRRVPEKVVQAQIRHALLSVGAAVYTIGRPPRRDAVFKGTGQTPGIPDLYALLPDTPTGPLMVPGHGLWIECKAKGGKLRPEQAAFQARCVDAGIPHLVGGLEDVLAYLLAHGYIREYPAQYRRDA